MMIATIYQRNIRTTSCTDRNEPSSRCYLFDWRARVHLQQSSMSTLIQLRYPFSEHMTVISRPKNRCRPAKGKKNASAFISIWYTGALIAPSLHFRHPSEMINPFHYEVSTSTRILSNVDASSWNCGWKATQKNICKAWNLTKRM